MELLEKQSSDLQIEKKNIDSKNKNDLFETVLDYWSQKDDSSKLKFFEILIENIK